MIIGNIFLIKKGRVNENYSLLFNHHILTADARMSVLEAKGKRVTAGNSNRKLF